MRIVLIFGLVGVVASAQANLLSNADFSVVGPNGSPTVHIGVNGLGSSSADSWSVWHNNNAVTTTQLVNSSNLLPAGVPTGATTGMLVTSTGASNGLFQTFGSNPANAFFDVYVWVLQGQVTIGAGNGGSTVGTANSTGINQWEHLVTASSSSPVNQVIIYSTGPSVFYVASANVSTVPEPATMAVLGLGAVALMRRRRK
jgi:hypothetical protein